MYTRHQFPISIDTTQPITMCLDYEPILKTMIEQEYDNKCYQGHLIKEITSIVNYSWPIMSQSTLECVAQISAVFEAKCYNMHKGDVIVNIQIAAITPNIALHTKNVQASMPMNPLLSSFTIGATLPVSVVSNLYVVNKSHITILASPYIFKRYTFAVNEVSNIIKPDIDNVIKLIKEERSKIDNTKINKYIRLIMLGISPKDTEPEQLPPISKELIFTDDIDSFANSIKNKIIISNYYDNSLTLSFTTSPMKLTDKIAVMDVHTFILQMLNEHLKFLQLLQDFMVTFPEDMISQSMNLWNLYYAVRTRSK